VIGPAAIGKVIIQRRPRRQKQSGPAAIGKMKARGRGSAGRCFGGNLAGAAAGRAAAGST